MAAGDTYSYSVSTFSWTGYRTRTVLQFEQGVGTYRAFESVQLIGGAPSGPLVLEWEERGAEVGSHTNAAPVATVDQLYDRCAADVLTQDPNRNTITLAFDEHGVLAECTYVPMGCADDCTMGVWLAELAMGNRS